MSSKEQNPEAVPPTPNSLKGVFKQIDDKFLNESRKKMDSNSKENSHILAELENKTFTLSKDLLVVVGTIFGSSIALAAGRSVNRLFIVGEFFIFVSLISGLFILITHLKAKEFDYAFLSKTNLESFLLLNRKRIEKFELESIDGLIDNYKKLISSNQSGLFYKLLKIISLEKWHIIFYSSFIIGIFLVLCSIIPDSVNIFSPSNLTIPLFYKLETNKILNSAGLLFDILGAGLLWKYGLPESISKQGHINLILEQTDDQEVLKAKRYDRLGKTGLLLLILGFAFQLLGNFWG